MNKEKWLQNYLDGELTPEEEQQALHIIADDAELRSLLRFETILKSAFTQDKYAVPDNFTENVMRQVRLASNADVQVQTTLSLKDRINEILDLFFLPRQLQLRPVYAMLLLLVFLIPSILFFDLRDSSSRAGDFVATQVSSTEALDKVMVRFVYVDNDAESIAIAGDFSDWKPINLEKQIMNDQSVWAGLIAMNSGEHQYMFVVNGEEWVTDPLASTYQDDGFGNRNAVIYL